MKSMRKDQLISEGIADNILIERNILLEGQCEFILTISFFFQSPERIYFVCPFIKGGDLFHKLKNEIFFKESLVQFYAAQVAIALQHLHDLGIAYRDLKPENILINEDGYIKLCDFGASVQIRGTEKAETFAGSPEYASPEMITYEGHNFMSDWWSFGILIYELLYGNTPFYNIDKNRMFDLIMKGAISYPKFIQIEGETKPRNYKVSEDAKSLINKLLVKDPGMRLGRKGLNEIKKHGFFSGINFEDLKKKKHKAPCTPTIDNEDETINFDEEYLNMEIEESPVADWSKEAEYNNWFEQFDNLDLGDNFENVDTPEGKDDEGGDEQ
jgi:serine/threonine protein kinase